MANLGDAAAFGGTALSQSIRQMVIDRMMQQKQAQDMSLAEREMALRQQEAAQRGKAQDATLAENTRYHTLEDQARQEGRVIQGANLRPIGAPVSGAEYQRETGLGIPSGIYAPQETDTPQAPEGIAALDAPAAPMTLRGTIKNSPSPTERSYTNLGTAGVQEKAAELAQKEREAQAARDAKVAAAAQAAQDKKDQIGLIASLKTPPEHPSSYQVQPELDANGKQTGRFFGYNTKANRWEPVQGDGPASTKPAPGAANAAEYERTKKDAIDTLTQLDQAIENARDLVGPGMGRVSNLEQMAGSADPRIQALGVKMKAAKMRVDHAVTGSVRGAASPVLLAQWDNILANKVTPEGLKAGVKAMREILGGGDVTTPASGGNVKHYDMQGNEIRQ